MKIAVTVESIPSGGFAIEFRSDNAVIGNAQTPTLHLACASAENMLFNFDRYGRPVIAAGEIRAAEK